MLIRLYVAAFALTALVGFSITTVVWRHRETTGEYVLGGVGVATAVWAGGTIGLVLATSPAGELRWLQVSYFGMIAAPITFVLLAIVYTGDGRYPTTVTGLLFGIGAFFLLLVWTNPAHHLYWATIDYSADVPAGIATTPGPGFWLFVAFSYLLLFVGSILFVRYALTAPHLYRTQTVVILVAVVAPWLANVPHALQLMTGDLTPLSLSVTVVALWIARSRYRLTEIGLSRCGASSKTSRSGSTSSTSGIGSWISTRGRGAVRCLRGRDRHAHTRTRTRRSDLQGDPADEGRTEYPKK